ncbi:hypothetical protein [Williamsia sp. CHRR-6]|uniref:hypothetical protein n=1 Tax=Williamsia sp. CHRR-6 TaxID=2835871 RepID=UPI001BD96A38|nr:hypothetical protein [Williamsia sp. CHRR-6]MBT0568510.1 hypothetical protein [Williamsia sp. CHRR-6]
MRLTDDDDPQQREMTAATRIASLLDGIDAEIDTLAADLTSLYRERIPVYALVARDDIERNTRAVLDIVVRQVRSDSPRINESELAMLARRWSAQQIPLEFVAHSIQVGARRLATVIRARAAERGFSSAVIDDLQDIMWHWATSYAAVINSVLQENAVSTAARRSTFMRRLIERAHPSLSLPAVLAENGIDADRTYHVAVADAEDPDFTSEVLARLRVRCGLAGAPVFDAVVDACVVALLPTVPADLEVSALVAVGPPTPPSDIGASYRQARRTLEIAQRFGRRGVLSPADLGTSTSRRR